MTTCQAQALDAIKRRPPSARPGPAFSFTAAQQHARALMELKMRAGTLRALPTVFSELS